MRVQLWLSSIASLLLFSVAATNAHAQFGGTPHPRASNPDYGSGSFFQASQMTGMSQYGPQPMPQYGPPPMGGYGGGYGAGGYDTGVMPDQNIFEKVLGASVAVPFKMNFSYTRTRTKSPDSVVIGDERASTKVNLITTDEEFDPITGETVDTNYADGVDPWGPIAVDEIYDEGPTGGFNIGFSIGNPRQAGLKVKGFWNQNYQTGQQFGDRSNLDLIFTSTGVLKPSALGISFPSDDEISDRLSAFFPGIPYNTGVPLENDPNLVFGDALGFDVFAEFKFETQVFGGSASQSFSAVYKTDSITIQPTAGVRYVGIREGFSLFGRQSGLNYLVTLPDGEITPIGGTQVTISQTLWPQINEALDTVVDSKVSSHLAGPDVGFSVNIGGKNLRITSESKVGLLVNREKISLRGSGLANNITYGGPELTFDQTETHTHISPMWEQSLSVQTNILRNVPVIRDIDLFDEAVFTAGFTQTHIWEVARPGSTIQWNGAPLVPKIEVNREHFWTSTWDFGVHWNY